MNELFILFFSLQLFSFPGISRDLKNCAVNYYDFCERVKEDLPHTKNMCPKDLKSSYKELCLINRDKQTLIKIGCEAEIEMICSSSDAFINEYICLVNPNNWSKFSNECLQTLSRGIHKSQPKNQI